MELSLQELDATRHLSQSLLAFIHAVESGAVQRSKARTAAEQRAAASTPRNKPPEPPTMLLNVRQAAKELAISDRMLFDMTAPRGPLPAVKLGGRVCYDRKDLERFIQQKKVQPQPSGSPD